MGLTKKAYLLLFLLCFLGIVFSFITVKGVEWPSIFSMIEEVRSASGINRPAVMLGILEQESFFTMLSEARKYHLALTLAHQQLAQLSAPLRAAILSNCRLQAYFQISRDDSNILAKESLVPIYNDPPGWEWYVQELQELGDRQCYIKNKNDGGVIAVRTLDREEPHKEAGMGEREFATEVAGAGIGRKYLRERKTIEADYRERLKKLIEVEEPKSFREPKRLL